MNYREISQVHEEVAARDITEKVDFVLADQPYNVRRRRDDENDWYDVFSTKDMKNMAAMCV